MKQIRLLPLSLLFTGALTAASTFPGLQSVMSEAEWKRAGLDHLTPGQIGIIDAAIIRHSAPAPRPAPLEPAARPAPVEPVAATPTRTPAPATHVTPPAPPAEPVRPKPGLLGRIGLAKSRSSTPAPAPSEPVVATAPPATRSPAEPERGKSGILERFGLSKPPGDDWRSQPPLVAHVVSWHGGNRVLLDNGQVWEGLEPIIFELPPGREVIIEARPLNGFAMKLDERSAVVRVQRVK